MNVLTQADPDVREILATIGDSSLSADTLEQLRGQPLRAAAPSSGTVEHTDHLVPGPSGGPDVPVRVHRPRDARGTLPCVYSIHGGGFVMGSHLGDGRLDSWCPALRCAGVSVGYRLAPETPFPGPLEDCYAGLRWVHSHAAELGIDSSRTGLLGGSAGGGLAAGLALLARDRGELLVAFQLLIYPMLDDRQITPSSRADRPVWPPASNRFGWMSYLGHQYGGDDVSPYAVPARATDLAALPSAFVMVGTLDGLLDEDIDYARRLSAAGVPADLHVYAGAPHGFDTMMAGAAVAQRARRTLEAWLKPQLHPDR